MNPLPTEPSRWSIYLLILISAFAAQAGRILSARSETGEVPFHSANDRSRWCTLVSLVEQGTYEIDEVINREEPKRKRKVWYSIDLVRHRGWDGKQHYFSSKPPLLTTTYAGIYWVYHQLTGQTLSEEPHFVGRTLLLIFNLIPLLLFWLLGIWLIERVTDNTWARLFCVVGLTWGSYISTFANTMNNHLPGAVAAMIVLVILIRLLVDDERKWYWALVAGFFGTWTVACELPALAWWAAAGGLMLFTTQPIRNALGYIAGSLPVAAGIVITTYLAHGDLRPPYAHRTAGPTIATVARTATPEETPAGTTEGTATEKKSTKASPATAIALLEKSLRDSQELADSTEPYKWSFREARQPETWEMMEENSQMAWAVRAAGDQWEIRQWDDWYDYPKSYWLPGKTNGVDKGEPSRLVYAFHALIGHRGIFSLTPIWCFALLGIVPIMQMPKGWKWIAAAVAAVTAVCILFYLARPIEDRNYGGVASGFRWVFWMTPLWMLFLPAGIAAVCRTNWSRGLAYAALGISILSATFPWTNPWSQPWLFQILEYGEWIKY